VYAEAGKRVLIPKGSRLIGSYAAKATAGQTRIAMSWQRVIRPDGLDLAMAGLGSSIDNLGRAGVEGLVDNHYFEVLYNAVLLSTAQVLWASTADKMTNSGAATTTNTTQPTGQTTTTSTNTATQQAIQSASTSMGDAVKSIAQTGLKTTPTITIDQGTTIKIYVNQDLVFPPQGSHTTTIKVVR
jgi:type IV secretion system protein VirB10